ncbi:hypothetical protein RE438_22805 [Bacillus wiedmannii]|uniref:hypothetical protein n=1 Tax=Bacillus wiedmannii TaxID=1890302 RepID=UPI00065B90B7|nr:hypothetical protein [Bacillus wiedmannii]KMP73854.1 hypothetical protein TU62_19060 [Bacillus cereus]MCQ6541670.1 hypothetical protein [Bacillus wiedmannii]MCQ6571488.1 hypothetical protein [Bacillus wiedmannii]WMS81271.1 hypothetical protein RE438_22805 [Bacillus wiedmannii]HDR7672448.1 hypothetical protein [Bacillus wiedmannii]
MFDVTFDDELTPQEAQPTKDRIELSNSDSENARASLMATSDHPALTSLLPKHLNFAHKLIEHNFHVEKASIDAGFTSKYGYQLMQRMDVRTAITVILNSQSFMHVAGEVEILKNATSIMRGRDSQGNPLYDEVINPRTGQKEQIAVPHRDRYRYVELLSKANGILKDGHTQLNIKTNRQITVDISEDDISIVTAHEERLRKDVIDGEIIEESQIQTEK